MTTDDFCFYLQNRLVQTSQTGGQWYSDTFPFIILDGVLSIGKTILGKLSCLIKKNETFKYGLKLLQLFVPHQPRKPEQVQQLSLQTLPMKINL